MSRTFYVNGEFVAEADAKVSVLDRGFLFADAVYEVSSVLGGNLIDNDAHMKRLHRSLSELSMQAPATDAELLTAQQKLIELNEVDEGLVYMQVTRGVADRDFAFPANATPTLVMFTQKKNLLNSPQAKTGIQVISVADIRWQRRDIKTVGLLGPALAKQAAADAGADDAWMVEDGFVTEGSSNNAYIVHHDGTIQTRHLGNEILSGITREAVLRLCGMTQHQYIEKPFTIEDAKKAKEAFVTSASSFVMPVVSIDGQDIGDGQPGEISVKLRELYIEIAREKGAFTDIPDDQSAAKPAQQV